MRAASVLVLLLALPLVSSQCVGVWSSMFDDWCNTNCALGFCPSSFCTCPAGPAATSITVAEFVDAACCDNPVEVYYIENSRVYHMVVDQNDHSIISEPTICASFLGPSDIEIGTDGTVYVADPVAGNVYALTDDCTTVNTVTSWTFDGVVDQPTALALGNGGLYVSGSTRIFFLTLNSDFEAETTTQLEFSILHADSMDVAPDGSLYLVQQGGSIYRWDGSVLQTFLTVHMFDIPDIEGIRVTDCGLYMSVTDSNQIWRCTDPLDVNTCERYCPLEDTDSHTCTNMGNPYGLTVDCHCAVYSAQRFDGSLVWNTDEESIIIQGGDFHPIDIEIVVEQDCAPPTPSRTRSPSPTASVTASPTRSPSPTSSLTRTPSPTASVSASSSSTPTPTASPTATRTASRSRSPSPTPSPLWEQFLVILDFNTACSAGTCDGVNQTQIDTYPGSSRAFSVQHSIRYHVASDAFDPNTGVYCDVQVQYTGTSLNYRCTRSVDPFAYIDFDPSVFQMFVALEDSGNGLPPFIVDIDRFPADTYPNALLKPAVSGLVNCIGYNDVSFRIAVQSPRPSWDDDVFGVLTMLDRGSLGPSPGLTSYIDADGNTADALAPYKEFVCVQDV